MSHYDLFQKIRQSDEAWRRDEVEPYAMPIVLRTERNVPLVHEDALVASALGVRALMLSNDVLEGGYMHDAVKQWSAGRIRKIVRKARASAWSKVSELPSVHAAFGTAEVLVLPPHPTAETPSEINKLQMQGIDLERSSEHANERRSASVVQIALNPEIAMTTGKAMAQVGHAMQLLLLSASESDIDAIAKAEVEIAAWPNDESWSCQVRDAGFTEVPAGSLTAQSRLISA